MPPVAPPPVFRRPAQLLIVTLTVTVFAVVVAFVTLQLRAVLREQVLRRCDVFSPSGGFVFNAIHNVQAQTPMSNLVAMFDAVHEFNGTAR